MYTGPNIVTDGLVLALDAANTKSYISGSATWNDLSGNNNSGSLVNGPTFSSANGGSIVFDGSDDYMSFSNLIVNTNIGFTWDFWIKLGDPQTIYPGVWSYIYNYRNVAAFEVGTYSPTGSPVSFLFKDNTTGSQIGSPFIGNIWTNVTIGCNTTIPFMYINGILRGTSTAFTNSDVPIINLFRSQFTGGSNYKANLSSFKVYNRALTASEVLQNYNGQKARFGLN
jgi:hypothetical protein